MIDCEEYYISVPNIEIYAKLLKKLYKNGHYFKSDKPEKWNNPIYWNKAVNRWNEYKYKTLVHFYKDCTNLSYSNKKFYNLPVVSAKEYLGLDEELE